MKFVLGWVRFDISHLRSLWAVGASWRARWPGSCWCWCDPLWYWYWRGTYWYILMSQILIFLFQNQHLSHWAVQLISGSHCTYCVHHLILILILLPCDVHCTYCIHHLAKNFFVSEWKIENECLEHVKHWIEFSSWLGVGGESIRLAFQTAFVQLLIEINVIDLSNYHL